MNRNNAAEYLPLVQALADGKTIQFRRNQNHDWKDFSALDFSHEPENYRIKPEPLEFEIWVSDDNTMFSVEDMSKVVGRKIRVREIVEND